MPSKVKNLPGFIKCTGCLACTDACKHNALRAEINSRGFFEIKFDVELCVHCNECVRVCPVINYPQLKNKYDPIAFMAWSMSDKVLSQCASGGAFTEIARTFFRVHAKAVVIGAKWTGDKVIHTTITAEENLWQLASSKYLQSDTRGIYSTMLDFLRNGYDVLFSGTPCQVSSARNMCRRYEQHLMTVELICHGVPSFDILTGALSYYDAERLISFRNKEKGWYNSQVCTYLLKDNSLTTPLNDIFYKMYLSEYFIRSSCLNCKYASLPRYADITIGDYLGKSLRKNNKGTSLLFANTQKAKDFMSEVQIYKTELSFKDVVNNSSRLTVNLYKNMLYFPRILWVNEYLKAASGHFIYLFYFKVFRKLVSYQIYKKEKLVSKSLKKYEKCRNNNNT